MFEMQSAVMLGVKYKTPQTKTKTTMEIILKTENRLLARSHLMFDGHASSTIGNAISPTAAAMEINIHTEQNNAPATVATAIRFCVPTIRLKYSIPAQITKVEA